MNVLSIVPLPYQPKEVSPTFLGMSGWYLWFYLFIQFLWLIGVFLFLWHYLEIKQGKQSRINEYIEDLYTNEDDYDLMRKGVTRYAFVNLLIVSLLFAAGLLFPSTQTQMYTSLFFLINRKVWKDWYKKNPNPTFTHRD